MVESVRFLHEKKVVHLDLKVRLCFSSGASCARSEAEQYLRRRVHSLLTRASLDVKPENFVFATKADDAPLKMIVSSGLKVLYSAQLASSELRCALASLWSSFHAAAWDLL
jgi:hypothetical protein